MASTLVNYKQNYKLSQQIRELQGAVADLRANQARKLIYIDITLDGTGSQGIIEIGTGTNAIYLQSRAGGGVDFFRQSDNVKIMSLDKNGNVRALGNITGNTSP